MNTATYHNLRRVEVLRPHENMPNLNGANMSTIWLLRSHAFLGRIEVLEESSSPLSTAVIGGMPEATSSANLRARLTAYQWLKQLSQAMAYH